MNLSLAEQDRQLAKLPYAHGAEFNAFHRQHERLCLPDTRVDLLSQFQEWSINHNRRIFWLNGMAGTGKSTIARTVAHSFHDQKSLGASFFFSRGVGDLGNATRFVGTLARQLANISPSLKDYICESIMEHSNVTSQGLRNQWKELIIRPLSRLNDRSLTLNLVVDALDECEHEKDVKLILQLFVETKDINKVNIGFFVTSRPETPIRLGFRDMPGIMHQDLVLHHIPRPIIEHDISVFLRHELARIGDTHNLRDWPGNEKIQQLVQASDCLFIYVATVCLFIGDQEWIPEERLHMILNPKSKSGLPTTALDEMYTQVLRCSLTKKRYKEDISGLSERFKRVVGAIATLFNVLSVTSLANLLSISAEKVNLCLSSLHSLLNIPDDPGIPIRLLHPSFRDFLLDRTRCQDVHFWIDREITNKDLATSCLRLLSDTLERDMCDLKEPGTMVLDVQDHINSRLSKDVRYASQYWVDHLGQIAHSHRVEIGLHDNGQVHNFLQAHLLHWLEALSLTGKTSEGVLMITKLEKILQVSSSLQSIKQKYLLEL